jgi:uncharacterized membrane protein YfcA
MITTVLLIIIFFVTWIITSIFTVAGLGGAVVLVPILYSLGIPFSVAADTGLFLNIFSLFIAMVNNARRGNVLWKLGTTLLIPAAAMAPVGAYVGSHAPKIALLWALTAFLSYTLYNLVRERAKVRSSRFYGSVKGYVLTALVGVITGFLSGMLGIGGAILILPVMVLIEEDIKKASATTGYIALLISVSGFTSYLLLLREKLWLVMLAERLWLVVLTGGSLGGLTGSYLLNRLRPFYVKYIVVFIIALVLVKILAELV